MEKYLIVGLGNPGSTYSKNRHNVGFLAIDVLCHQLNLELNESKFNGMYTSTNINSNKVFIAKPTTYMNLSGEFVSKMINFYDIKKENVIVLYDDVDTKLGEIKLRYKGSSGGQNGIKNIIQLLGTQEIKRIRIGIGRDDSKPLNQYVLSNFKSEEFAILRPILMKVSQAIIESIGNPYDKIMNKYN